MKLFIIVLCLLSERYLTHHAALYRFNWFPYYTQSLLSRFPQHSITHAWLLLLVVVLPILLITGIVLWLLQFILYGFFAFLLHLIIFYYCLGPDNIFYPVTTATAASVTDPNSQTLEPNADVKRYLAAANSQLFSVIFWYIVLGPLTILLYRMVSLCQKEMRLEPAAKIVTDIIEWIPARLSAILYLLAGNFQYGFRYFLTMFLKAPNQNNRMLGQTGLYALHSGGEEHLFALPYAQQLVEHAMIVYLVLLALLTIAAWM